MDQKSPLPLAGEGGERSEQGEGRREAAEQLLKEHCAFSTFAYSFGATCSAALTRSCFACKLAVTTSPASGRGDYKFSVTKLRNLYKNDIVVRLILEMTISGSITRSNYQYDKISPL